MPHYKDPDNTLHWLDSAEFEYVLPAGSVLITDEEAEALRPAPMPEAPVAPVDPVDKLKEFLAANPDVAAVLKG